MRRNWLLLGIALLVAVLAIGAVACSDDDDDTNGDEPEATEVIDDGNGDEPEATEEVTDGDGDGDEVTSLVATILAVDDSGVSGDVTISPDIDGILVDVIAAGLPEGTRANHLHHGEACPPDPGGEVHIPLTEVEADADGNGSQTSSDDTEAIAHFAEGHYYAIHDADGAVIGCGTVVSGV